MGGTFHPTRGAVQWYAHDLEALSGEGLAGAKTTMSVLRRGSETFEWAEVVRFMRMAAVRWVRQLPLEPRHRRSCLLFGNCRRQVRRVQRRRRGRAFEPNAGFLHLYLVD